LVLNFFKINILVFNLFLTTIIFGNNLNNDQNNSTKIKVLQRWSKEFISGIGSPVIKKYDRLITPLLSGNLQILDFNSGQIINRYNFGKGPILEMSYFNSNLSFIMPLEKKSLRSFNLDSEKYILKKKNKFTPKYCIQNSNDSLIVSNDYNISLINKINGDVFWSINFNIPLVVRPYISNDQIIVINEKNQILIFSLKSGEIISSNKIDNDFQDKLRVYGSLVKSNDNIFLASYFGNIFSINIYDSRINWFERGDDQIYTSPKFYQNNLIITDASGKIRTYNKLTGTIVWKYDIKLLINKDLIFMDDFIIISSEIGKLFFLDKNTGNLISSYQKKGRIVSIEKITDSHIIIVDDLKKMSLFEIKK